LGVNYPPLKLKLREVMKEKGVTQMELSKKANVRQAAISELCRNEREEVNLAMLTRIADALNIKNVSVLMQFEENEE
jgi:transcriptional regulator with XRE-family HTH domain